MSCPIRSRTLGSRPISYTREPTLPSVAELVLAFQTTLSNLGLTAAPKRSTNAIARNGEVGAMGMASPQRYCSSIQD
jgi:hypothetical protein